MIKDNLRVEDIKVGLIAITEDDTEYVLFGRVSSGKFLFKLYTSKILEKDYVVLELKDMLEKFKGYRHEDILELSLKRYYLKNELLDKDLGATYFDSILETEETMEEYCTYYDIDIGDKYIYLGNHRLFGEDLKIRYVNKVGRLVYLGNEYTSSNIINHRQLTTYLRESKNVKL